MAENYSGIIQLWRSIRTEARIHHFTDDGEDELLFLNDKERGDVTLLEKKTLMTNPSYGEKNPNCNDESRYSSDRGTGRRRATSPLSPTLVLFLEPHGKLYLKLQHVLAQLKASV